MRVEFFAEQDVLARVNEMVVSYAPNNPKGQTILKTIWVTQAEHEALVKEVAEYRELYNTDPWWYKCLRVLPT